MARVSKKPEVRKQELIDTAIRLFFEKGYDNVSVRDILREVDGAPGMFYHYFGSKQEIYDAAIEQFLADVTRRRIEIIDQKALPVARRLLMITKSMIDDYESFHSLSKPENAVFGMLMVMKMLDSLVNPITELIAEGLATGEIPKTARINQENAQQVAIFILHGSNGMLRTLNADEGHANISMVYPFILHFLQIDEEDF